MKNFLLVFFLFLITILFGQDITIIDSIKQEDLNVSIIAKELDTFNRIQDKSSLKYRFFNTLLNKNTNSFLGEMILISNQENSQYSQMSIMELAKISYLNTNYLKSLEYLNKITLSQLSIEKYYWLASVNYKLKNYSQAIWDAQEYIILSDDKYRIEICYMIISQSFMDSKKFKLALNHLNELRAMDNISFNFPFMLYQIAQCYENLENKKGAATIYGELIRDYPTSRYAALARVKSNSKEMNKYKKNMTASFVAEQQKGNYFIQIGAFGDVKNAQRRTNELKDLGYKPQNRTKLVDTNKITIVTVGPFATIEQVNDARSFLKSNGINSFLLKENLIQSNKKHYIQAGVFSKADNVKRMQDRLTTLGYNVTPIQRMVAERSLFYVLVGPFDTIVKAKETITTLKETENIDSVLFIK